MELLIPLILGIVASLVSATATLWTRMLFVDQRTSVEIKIDGKVIKVELSGDESSEKISELIAEHLPKSET